LGEAAQLTVFVVGRRATNGSFRLRGIWNPVMNGQDKGDLWTPAIWADSRLLAGNVVRQLLVPEGSFKVDTT
jgi:hypothetical protein